MSSPARHRSPHAPPSAARMRPYRSRSQRLKRMCGCNPHPIPQTLDASYKQYTFTPGMDLASAVPLDTQALLAAAEQGAQSNAAEGFHCGSNGTEWGGFP